MEKLLSVAVIFEKTGGNGFYLPEIILAGIRFCINNLFLQDTVTVVMHKSRRFLKEISKGDSLLEGLLRAPPIYCVSTILTLLWPHDSNK